MTGAHLSMVELLAVRDGDRSEPALAAAHLHIEGCGLCREELSRLHQRTAHLRALPMLTPPADLFPAVRTVIRQEKQVRWGRRIAVAGLAAAASLAIALVGGDLADPDLLRAEAKLDEAMMQSEVLERTLQEVRPDDQVLDGGTVYVIVKLEDRIASVDARLAEVARLEREHRLLREVQLWQERVGLMNELVKVRVTRTANVTP